MDLGSEGLRYDWVGTEARSLEERFTDQEDVHVCTDFDVQEPIETSDAPIIMNAWNPHDILYLAPYDWEGFDLLEAEECWLDPLTQAAAMELNMTTISHFICYSQGGAYVLTHEVGHATGLGHKAVEENVMAGPGYNAGESVAPDQQYNFRSGVDDYEIVFPVP